MSEGLEGDRTLLRASGRGYSGGRNYSFASRLVMRGVDLYTVTELLGHQSIEMSQRYAHLGPDFLKQSVEVLVQQPSKQPLASVSA